MTGSGLAQLIIPIAGTLFLTAGLALVFYADSRPRRADGTPAPGHEIPGPAALAAQEDLLAGSMERENLRVIFEGER
jgi:hypothetical protein